MVTACQGNSLKAATHPQQTARLAVLREYDILDTPREGDFDDIVHLASEICGVPISVVNLIDAERQWFKAEIGLGVRETPLETSICSHAILEQDFVEIPDTLSDARMRDNALCAGDPGLRFYAGALLKAENGLPLGTLCVLDYQPRTLSGLQKHALQVLAKQVMAQLNLRLALKRQELLAKEIDHRVKNSLASVAALVRLQMTRARAPDLRSALAGVEQRVRTIALLHEELYQTTAFDKVDLAHYLPKLGVMLRSNAPDNVSINVQAASVAVDSGKASALGVIVSEFVMNSIKHAFPGQRPGAIRIELRSTAGGAIELACEDNGVGAPAAPVSPGLGLRLIDASAASVNGVAERASSPSGYKLKVTFRP